jgi:hypothetical protein
MIDKADTACRCAGRPLRPHEYWPWEYELQSRREGWILANDSDDCTTISRIDDPASIDPQLEFTEPKFAGDQAAQAWVIEQASQGSRLHMLAVYLTGFPVRQPLNIEPPDCVLPLNPAAERALRRNPNVMPKLRRFRFDLGDSTEGPIGLSAMIYAIDKEDALERLASVLREHSMIPIYIGSSQTDPIQYVNVHVSLENICSNAADEVGGVLR